MQKKKKLKSKLNHMQYAQLNLTLSLIKNVTIMFFFIIQLPQISN